MDGDQYPAAPHGFEGPARPADGRRHGSIKGMPANIRRRVREFSGEPAARCFIFFKSVLPPDPHAPSAVGQMQTGRSRPDTGCALLVGGRSQLVLLSGPPRQESTARPSENRKAEELGRVRAQL